jgi:3-hydroxybutyrate dehydrogenase
VTALENAEKNITANAICPGWVLTPLVQKQIDDNAKEKKISAEAAKADLLGLKEPSMRFSTPEQLGALAVFLCSPGGDNLTGTSLSHDGGWTAQ